MARQNRQALIDRLAARVASGQSVSGAARSEQVPERTAREWAATPEFKQAVKTARESVFARTVGRLGRLSVKAVERLGRLVNSSDEDVALKASVALIDKTLAVRDQFDLAERLCDLEARLNGQKAPVR